jgi:AcrR family transcriptional regulator
MALVSSEKAGASAVARHIARVAARLFAMEGYDATSVRTIVEAAGVTKPTLYYHFGSKEGLAQALLTLPMTGLENTLRAIAGANGDPVSALEQTFEAHFGFCREEPDRARFFFALVFGPHGSGKLAEELFRFGDAMDAQTIEIVQRLSAAGVVAPGRVEDCARHCCGLIRMAVMDFLFKGGPLDEAQARRLVGDLLWGFGVPGSTGKARGE